MRFRIANYALVLMALAGPLRAEVVENLYLAEIPVESQDPEVRKTAIGQGMREVLVRVSGETMILGVPAIDAALDQPKRFVDRYRYQIRKLPGGDQLEVWAKFDEKAINKLLRDNRLPVWGRNRPVTLLWLVVDDRKTGRKLISTDSKDSDISTLVEQQARQRGLPLRLPLYDLSDRARLKVSDVWGNFEDRIIDASARYQTHSVLVGRVYKANSGSWSGSWTLYSDGRRSDWESSGASMGLALLPGVSGAADALAQRYAQVEDKTASPDLVKLQVEGVASLPAYNKVNKYLDSLDVVSRVEPMAIQPDSVVFNLTSRGGRLAVEEAISFGRMLIPDTPTAPQANSLSSSSTTPVTPAQPPASPSNQVDLVYRLVP
ncbi:MAG: DUF2066 domain-containing protein [Proteobacteria bacterium]|jgi:hypothetical protein|nr:DUF2066 domain-containing protein [Pseudomonadota bacterium]